MKTIRVGIKKKQKTENSLLFAIRTKLTWKTLMHHRTLRLGGIIESRFLIVEKPSIFAFRRHLFLYTKCYLINNYPIPIPVVNISTFHAIHLLV